MISIEKCKEILNKSERKFTNDEVKKIRDYLYIAATIENDKFKIEQKKDSSNIYQSID